MVAANKHTALSERPFVAVLPIIVVGILVAKYTILPVWLWASGCAVTVVIAWFYLTKLSVGVALFLFATTISSWQQTTSYSTQQAGISVSLQQWASERVDRLDLPDQVNGIVQAISIGNKIGIDREVRQDYSSSGAAHLLAVSGLHVGIVALLVNGLLILLGLVRRGHIWRNVIAIVAIWAYALLSGGSPSVIRAAIMFSGAQIAYASSQRYDGVNILLATASVMLIINSNYLFNISFQLSFVAVAGIFLLYRPLYNLVKTRYRLLNLLWAIIIIGITASLATAPLVSYYFGRVSLIGVVLNPVIIATAHIIVCVSLVWIIAPLGFMTGIVGSILMWVTGFQNSVVAVTAEQSWGIANIRFNLIETLAVYAIITAVFIVSRNFLTRHNDSKRYTPAHKRPDKAKH